MEEKAVKKISKKEIEKLGETIESILCKIDENKKGCISLNLDTPLCVVFALIIVNTLGLVSIPWLIVIAPILIVYVLRFLLRAALLGLAYKVIKDGGFTIEE